MGKWILSIILALLLLGTATAGSKEHNSKDPLKCSVCAPAYEKAIQATRKNLRSAHFPTMMMMGWVLLADGRFPKDVEQVVNTAVSRWKSYSKQVKHGTNWCPVLAGQFLAEYYKYNPSKKLLKVFAEMVKHFESQQEPSTGCWGKWLGQGLTGYPVKDMGMLSCIIFGFLHTVKKFGVEVDKDMLSRADARLQRNLSRRGMSYGTGQRGPDIPSGRGGGIMRNLAFAGMKSHVIYTTYKALLPKMIPNMHKGHHIGGYHCQSVVLGCFTLGSSAYKQLTNYWLDKLIARQDADGGVYVGDDGADGGEKGLLGGNHASTAAFALMILLQDSSRLKPGKDPKINWLSVAAPKLKSKRITRIAQTAGKGRLDEALKKLTEVSKTGSKILDPGMSLEDEKKEAAKLKAAIEKHITALLAKAEELQKRSELVQALAIYKALAKGVKNHEAGPKARKAIDAINADANLLRELEAEKALIKANRAVFRDGLKMADEKFQKIIDQYPKTRAAKKARAVIAE
ncbi:MAG: hypothetical protein E3J72_12735 [Planctomycetota bacterium]|nr:MAG: hypothetical protein E3J72_12735 [Planctomycetota bacterium]